MNLKALFTKGIIPIVAFSFGTLAEAYELSPNPNPIGSTINVSTLNAESHGEPYENFGTVNILSGGQLTNFLELTIIRGLVNIQSGGKFINDGTNGVFVVDEVGTASNSGTIDNHGRFKNSFRFNNNMGGLFTNYVGAELTNTRGMDQRGSLINSGSFLNSSGPFSNTDALLQNVGTWTNTLGSNWINHAITENFGTIDNSGNFINRFNLSSGISSGKISNRGTVNNLSGGNMTNQHRWFNRSGSSLNNSGIFTNSVSGLGISNESNATINNLADGVFINQSSLNNAGTIKNAGLFDVQLGASNLLKAGQYIQSSGTTIINGSMQSLLLDIQGGVLTGTGLIDANVNIGTAASLLPGNSPGTLTILGDLDLAGILVAEIRDALIFDVVNITGNVTLGGSLDVSFFDLWRPAAGDTFDILVADSISGTFNGLNLASLDSGLAWDLRYLLDPSGTDSLQLAVISSVPLPASFWLFFSGLTSFYLKKRLVSFRTLPIASRLLSIPNRFCTRLLIGRRYFSY